MNISTKTVLSVFFGVFVLTSSNVVFSHGDVSPQPVNTEGLEKLGEEWKEINPYRGNGLAAEIGSSAYNSNCARCHGLQAVSGGIAPDLRELPWGEEGDVYYVDKVRNGAIRNGVTYMPKFEGVVSQEGLWSIRAWLDSVNVNKPDDFTLTKVEGGGTAGVEEKKVAEPEPAPVVAANVGERTGQEIVKKTCATCHALGIANAPKIDPSGKAEWEKRTVYGLDAMIEVVKKGKGGMPPMGADPTLTDEELKRAILHMLTLAGMLAGSTDVSQKVEAPKVSKAPKLVFAPKKMETPKVTDKKEAKEVEITSNEAYLKAVKEADEYTNAEIKKLESAGSLKFEMLFSLLLILLLRGLRMKGRRTIVIS